MTGEVFYHPMSASQTLEGSSLKNSSRMVLKKRRKGTKVTRKPQKHIGVRIKNKIAKQEFMRDEWDHTRSPADNLSSFGLNPDPNRTFSSSREGIGRKTKPKDPSSGSAAFMGVAEVPRADYKEKNDRARVMSEEKQKYAASCIKNHGDNYEKCAMDLKVNYNQNTANQIKKQCEKFIALGEKDRLVPVPEPKSKGK